MSTHDAHVTGGSAYAAAVTATGEDQDEVLQSRADRPVVRHGDQVRHPRHPWSESVQELLAYLADAGFAESPRPGGVWGDHDDVGYIEGLSGDEACTLVQTDFAVAEVAQLLRRYHDTVEGWQPETEPVWFDGRRGTGSRPGELVCHGDTGPWNLVWDLVRPPGQQLVGLIDWEYATVGTRLTDIGYALHYLAPLRDRSYWHGVLGMARKPRRRHRMAVFAEAYGVRLDEDLVDAVVASQQAGVQLMIDLAALGRPRQIQLIAAGELEREQRAVDWTERHRHKFSRAGATVLPDA